MIPQALSLLLSSHTTHGVIYQSPYPRTQAPTFSIRMNTGKLYVPISPLSAPVRLKLKTPASFTPIHSRSLRSRLLSHTDTRRLGLHRSQNWFRWQSRHCPCLCGAGRARYSHLPNVHTQEELQSGRSQVVNLWFCILAVPQQLAIHQLKFIFK